MVKYRNQHYVPESYLEGWATNTRIPLLHLPTGREHSEPISDVCSRNYFYSQTNFLEIRLGKLESAHAAAFDKLRKGDDIRDLSRHNRRLLHSFVFTQRHRTKVMLDEIKEFGREFWRDYVDESAEDVEAPPDELAEYQDARFEHHMMGVHQQMMAYGILSPFMIGDLEIDLFHNETDVGFLTSDAPVILANPRFRKQFDMRYAGLDNRGLQVYCPIGPELCLFIYDSAAYTTDGTRHEPLLLTTEDEVKQLNMLQILNADSVAFYKTPGRDEEIAALREEYQDYNTTKHIPLSYDIDDETTREYESELRNPIHGLDPTLGPVHLCKNVDPGIRPNVKREEAQQYVHELVGSTEYSEFVLAAAIRRLLKSA